MDSIQWFVLRKYFFFLQKWAYVELDSVCLEKVKTAELRELISPINDNE